MSHPDPYVGEPRGWDRPERPAALPWPEPEIEAGQWSRRPPGPELYAEPRTRPYAEPMPTDPYDERGRAVRPDDRDRFDDRDRRDRFDDRGRYEDERNQPGRYDDRGHAGRYGDRPPAGRDGTSTRRDGPQRYDEPGGYDEPGRYDGPEPFGGPVRFDDDAEYPTAQIAPIGAELGPDLDPVAEPEPPAGRRPKGRRRASVDRPPTQQLGTGRAGRNLPAAIGVGLGLGALIVVPLVFYPLAFLPVIAGAMAIGIWEMARAVRRSGAHPPLVPLVAGGVLTVGLAWFAGPDALSLGLLVTVLGTMIWRLGDGPAGFQRDLTAATLIAVYVPFLGGFAALLAAAPDDGPLRILATLIAVVLSDTGGYAAGVSFGRHPMAPSISPKKSWEGFAGSVTAAALGSALLLWLMLDVAPWWGALFGVAVSCAAVLGDLAESMIKRDLGVKDMSNLLPGHGGLMDRLDSILFAVPAAYLLLAIFVPVVG
ncbi:phosphatidate cytidylyltransferase [Micromonospora sp. STR1_7]|uniref:Phosphatidate cytidylyltransferase n=1 Tax=Micromonospora parastrephiae TaxID=2806101 RepID=A0ABS1Y0T3_9ACTN|nr:phosphatidate cytidylyltransferase [Micromonospora parastrephiae]MBM0235130.1 phosphatidate cytidylyltransferase [Micromonospora parastrephiae]